ncbi:MAG: hypothetical protein J6U95_04910 [Alistipes sp.]|nr:hypothetical protein [Alistipes sp.]
MRKIFTSLKSVVSAVIIAAMAFSVSCSYDDTAINDRVDQVENDLKALTERVDALEKKLGAEVESLKALIDGKAVIVDVTEDTDGNTVIKLSDGKTLTVLAAQNALQYRVVDGVLEVSADGENWVAINGVSADQVVADVVLNEDGTATVKLANGDEFTVVKAELIECEAAKSGVYVLPDSVKEVAFSVNDAVVDINVMNQPLGWSATVEEAVEAPEAPEAGDEGGAAPMPLAAGGKDYVLKINGPAAAFKQAAKSGVVSVHFNTAAGACKVLQVNVTLAELTIDVDADGNITITNSIAYEQTDYFGDKFFDFANFFVGVMEASVYAEYGDNAFKDNHSYGNFYANINVTRRTTGLNNVFDNVFYEEGVCEKEVIQLTDQLLGKAFDPKYEFEYGKEYILFVTLDSEIVGGYELPILKNAVMANYKKSLLNAEYVSSNWKGADFKFSLAGYTHYLVGWLPVQEVEQYIMYGLGASAEEVIPAYINAYSVMSSGAIIPAENIEIGETVALADLASRSFYEWAQDLMTETEYYLYVYPFNAPGGENDFYSLAPTKDDVYVYGTFTTGSVEVGDFDAAAEFEIVSWQKEYVEEWDGNYDVLTVNATFGSAVTEIVYAELYGPAVDSEEGVAEVMNNYSKATAKVDGDVTIKIVYPSDPTYLGVVAFNAEGKAVYVEAKLEKPVAPATDVAATAASAYFVPGSSYNTYVDFTLENGETATIPFRTGDGGWDGDLYFNKGFNYINIGEWYDYSNKGESEVWYNSVYLNGADASIRGAIVVDYNADGYSFKFRIDDYNVTYVGAVEGLVAPANYVAGEPETPAYDYDITFTKCENLAGNNLTFTNDEGYKWVMALTNPLAEGVLEGETGNWDGNSTTIEVPGAQYPGYCYNGTFTVTKDGDNYAISFITDPWINSVHTNCRFAYNGPVEASSGPDLTGYSEGTGAYVDHNEGTGTVRFKLTYLDEVVLQIYPFFGHESDVHFNVGESQVEKLTLSGLNAESGKVDLYKQADGSYLVMVDATFQMVGAQKFYFYVTL